MNRRIALLALAALLAVAGFWVAQTADQASALRSRRLLPEFLLKRPGRDEAPPRPGSVTREFAVVSCTVDDPNRDAGSLVARGSSGELEVASANSRVFNLTLAPGEWSLSWLGSDGTRSLGTFSLEAGDIERCKLSGSWTVEGWVENLQGRALAGIEVAGCGGQTTTADDGHFVLSATRGDCEVYATHVDGLLRRRSQPFPFSPFDESNEVELALDDRPVGGIGLVLATNEEGVLVEEVKEDTPASEAGLLGGDVVVAVDGRPTEGWNANDAVGAITGTPGTIVRLDVLRNDEAFSYAVRRERL